jgi:hypothetical protein
LLVNVLRRVFRRTLPNGYSLIDFYAASKCLMSENTHSFAYKSLSSVIGDYSHNPSSTRNPSLKPRHALLSTTLAKYTPIAQPLSMVLSEDYAQAKPPLKCFIWTPCSPSTQTFVEFNKVPSYTLLSWGKWGGMFLDTSDEGLRLSMIVLTSSLVTAKHTVRS